MGKTLTEWTDQVEELLRDAGNVDVSTAQVQTVGIDPALAQFSVDRPYEDVVESAGAGSAYLTLPSDWSEGFSRVVAIEYPARQNPPEYIDDQAFAVVRDQTTVGTRRILLDGYTPSASEYVRVTFTRPYPTPTATAGDDLVPPAAFHAVAALAASFLCNHLAAQAARNREGAFPTDYTLGDDRVRMLRNIGLGYRDVYLAFLGRGLAGDGAGGSAPVSRRFDYDPGHESLFHGGRR